MLKQVLQRCPGCPSSSHIFITGTTLQRRRLGEQPFSTASHEEQKKRQRIHYELDYFRLLNDNLPTRITPNQWQALLETRTESNRTHYYKRLAQKEAKSSQKNVQIRNNVHTPVAVETCQHNSLMFLDGSEQFSADVPNKDSSLWRDRVKEVQYHRGARSFVHGSPVVLDADFPMDTMTEKMACNHVRFCNKINLHQNDPLHMCVTGVRGKNMLADRLNFLKDDFYLDSFDESFMDLCDRRRLVYLLPTGPPMPSFHPDAIYVIQLIDHHHNMPPTALWKAKKLGISYHGLPFNRYPRSIKPRFTPSVPLLFRMLSDLHTNRDFEKAFQRVQQVQSFF